MFQSSAFTVYQLKATIAEISPLIWRRLQVSSETTIAQLHYIIQMAFGWTDSYLHHFVIHAKQYGVDKPCGLWFSDNANTVVLGQLGLRARERFLYEYNFFDHWQVQLRVEKIIERKTKLTHPKCMTGKCSGPLENCGGPQIFQMLRQEFSDVYVTCRIAEIIVGSAPINRRELRNLHYWLLFEKPDFSELNRRLQQSPLSEDPAFTEEIIYLD